jgi:translation elongation factor EF-1beta
LKNGFQKIKLKKSKKPRKPKRSWWSSGNSSSNNNENSTPWWMSGSGNNNDEDEEEEEVTPGPTIGVISCIASEPETDMKKVEELVRSIKLESLEWKASEVVDYIYGLKKFRISCEVDTSKTTNEELSKHLDALDINFIQNADIVEWERIVDV